MTEKMTGLDDIAAILDLSQAPPSPDRLTSATNSFSSLDVPSGTSPSDKTVFARADSSWERGILRKSSIVGDPDTLARWAVDVSKKTGVALPKL
ncbi:hypothetical protein HY003_04340 [Candidatus Saccharibacteria bacterium]|nr:hypothetical protein [Candidatus Saccharibacteria bacterium]MBI3338498.1 hypothetical protein [Candidatus Saccharibacteria bacterium]